MRCAIWYHLYNLKNVKNNHGGVLILVKLQAASHISKDLVFQSNSLHFNIFLKQLFKSDLQNSCSEIFGKFYRKKLMAKSVQLNVASCRPVKLYSSSVPFSVIEDIRKKAPLVGFSAIISMSLHYVFDPLHYVFDTFNISLGDILG